MKYTSPTYKNELIETKDVITTSLISESVSQTNPEEVSYGTKAEDILGM